MGRSVVTGVGGLDAVLGELEEGSVTVLAGRPAQGKSLLALAIARNVAASGCGVCYVSLEMMRGELAERLVGSVAGVSQHEYAKALRRSGEPYASDSEEQDDKAWLVDATRRLRDARNLVGKLPLYVEDGQVRNADGQSACLAMGINGLRSTLAEASRRLVLDHNAGVGLLVVDYAQLLVDSPSGGGRLVRTRHLAEGIKHLAAGTGARVLLLSQLGRIPDGERPELSHLREAGATEEYADNVVAIYRPNAGMELGEGMTKDEADDLRSEAELIVLKHRHGSLGMAPVSIDDRLGRISSAGE